MKIIHTYKIVAAALLLLLTTSTVSARKLSDFFVQMPNSVLPLFSDVNRADCIDFIASNMEAKITNRLDGQSVMDTLTTDFLHIQVTKSSTFALKMLPYRHDTLLVAIHTVKAPEADSEVTVYNQHWRKLKTADFVDVPVLKDFFKAPIASKMTSENKDSVQTFEHLKKLFTMNLMQAEMSPVHDSITWTCTTPETFSEEEQKKLKPYWREKLVRRVAEKALKRRIVHALPSK